MSAISETLDVLKRALQLTERVERVGKVLEELADSVDDHEKRLIRLETKWDTALQVTSLIGNNPSGR